MGLTKKKRGSEGRLLEDPYCGRVCPKLTGQGGPGRNPRILVSIVVAAEWPIRILTSNVLAAEWPIRILTSNVLAAEWPIPHSHFKRVGRGVADPRTLTSDVLAAE